jgi:hypothetical protein
MVKIVGANQEDHRNHFQMLLRILCCIKVIPTWQNSNKFSILSVPSLLATFWCWIPLAYWIYSRFLIFELYSAGTNMTNVTAANLNQTASTANMAIDFYLLYALLLLIFLLILLLPEVLGHFFSLNKPAMLQLKFCWPRHCWMLVSSAMFIILGETIRNLFLSKFQFSTIALYGLTSTVSVYVTAAFLQFMALFLIGVRLTNFIEIDAAHTTAITANTIHNLFEEYNKIHQGLQPLFALLFCVHTPLILCFTFFVLSYVNSTSDAIWHCGIVFWSCLTLIYVCLLSEYCYDAVQVGIEYFQFYFLRVKGKVK